MHGFIGVHREVTCRVVSATFHTCRDFVKLDFQGRRVSMIGAGYFRKQWRSDSGFPGLEVLMWRVVG